MSILDEIEINESGLSRVYKHMLEHDCGIITAIRYAEDCGKGRIYTKEDNLKRMRSLESKLHNERYDLTSMQGGYIENYGSDEAREVKERVLFVVDVDNKNNLFNDLKQLGEEFEQDSIMFIPKIGTQKEIKSILYGTNHCEKAYPGYGKSKYYTERMMGHTGEFFTRVKDRPFIFDKLLEINHYPMPQGFFGRWGCDSVAKTKWQNI
jgi:hypothetical protein